MTNLTHARTHIRLCGALVSTRAYVSRSSLDILTIVVERKSQGAVPASQQKHPLAHGPFRAFLQAFRLWNEEPKRSITM